MKYYAHWMPTAFCACLSAVAIWAETRSGVDSFATNSSFVWFLPMCFFLLRHRDHNDAQRVEGIAHTPRGDGSQKNRGLEPGSGPMKTEPNQSLQPTAPSGRG